MKKKLLAGLLTSASVLGVCLVGGATSHAAVVQSENTDLEIGFTAHNPGPGNPLEIKWSPIKLDFGTANLVNNTPASVTYNASTVSRKYVVVSDTRAGAPTNEWKLTAGMTNLTSSASTPGVGPLTGATLGITGVLRDYTGGTAAPEAPGSISTAAFAGTADWSATSPAGAITIPANSIAAPVAIMEDNGNGAATGSTRLTMDTAMELTNVGLTVQQNTAVAGEVYEGTLTWSLDDAI